MALRNQIEIRNQGHAWQEPHLEQNTRTSVHAASPKGCYFWNYRGYEICSVKQKCEDSFHSLIRRDQDV